MTAGIAMWITHSVAFGIWFVLCAVMAGGRDE